MKTIASTDEYTIYLKRNNRHAVRSADRSWVNGDDKTAILLKHELIKAPMQKAPEPAPEAEPEAPAADAAEGGSEDTEAEASTD